MTLAVGKKLNTNWPTGFLCSLSSCFKVDLSTIPCQATCSNSVNCISMSAIKIGIIPPTDSCLVAKAEQIIKNEQKIRLFKYVFVIFSQQTERK